MTNHFTRLIGGTFSLTVDGTTIDTTYLGAASNIEMMIEKLQAVQPTKTPQGHFTDIDQTLAPEGAMFIPLSRGKVAIVDAADFAEVNKYKWSFLPNRKGYAVRSDSSTGKRRLVYMHREILNPEPGFETDHANGNSLDNRRSNLRQATSSDNMCNRSIPANSTSKYRGVTKKSDGWRSSIGRNGRLIHLGTFPTEREAAEVRDEAARQLHGRFARLNFPDEVQS